MKYIEMVRLIRQLHKCYTAKMFTLWLDPWPQSEKVRLTPLVIILQIYVLSEGTAGSIGLPPGELSHIYGKIHHATNWKTHEFSMDIFHHCFSVAGQSSHELVFENRPQVHTARRDPRKHRSDAQLLVESSRNPLEFCDISLQSIQSMIKYHITQWVKMFHEVISWKTRESPPCCE